MFAPPSIQKEYALVFSGDPALMLPTDDNERSNALRVARETGNWAALVKAGEQPTLFYVRPLPGASVAWLSSEMKFSSEHQRPLNSEESFELALRLALRRVENFGGFEPRFKNYHGQDLATVDAINAIYGIGGDLDVQIGRTAVAELGWLVWSRAVGGARPK